MSPSVAVCLLFFQKLEQTIECIESCINEKVVIYVLNNGSDKDSYVILKSRFSEFNNIKFYDSTENLGPARGRNFLLSKVTEDWIVLVDNDITITPKDWHNQLLSAVKAEKEAEIFIPKLFNVHENAYAQFQPFYLRDDNLYDSAVEAGYPDEKGKVNWFPSGASIVKKEFFDEIGLFDNNLFAFEDYELGIRCLKLKRSLKIEFVSSIIFVHDHRYQPQRKDKESVLQRYNSIKLLDSFTHIENKFNVKINHDYRFWTERQVKAMTKSKTDLLIERAVSKFKKIFYV